MLDDDLILSDIEAARTLKQIDEDITNKDLTEDPLQEILVICFADNCSEQNTKNCRKCNRPFCILHCNTFSPNFCKDCFRDLGIVAEKFKRTFEHIADSGQMYVKTEEKIKYYMDGPDWPFINPWIHTLDDDQLKSLWVFHHCIMRLIESENETRRIEHNRKVREASPATRLITGIQKTKTGNVIKTVKPLDTAEDVRKRLKKQGLPDAIIDMMIAAMEKKS